MKTRKWVARVLVLLLLALVGGGWYLYELWTNPKAIRAALIAELSRRFPGATVRVDSARLRLFGGIEVQGLSLARRDDPGGTPFLSVPRAVLQHDKEALSHGKLNIRKIELIQPQIRLVRRTDRSWNVVGISAPAEGQGVMPLVEIRDGAVSLVDETQPQATLELRELRLAVAETNGLLRMHASLKCDLLGSIEASAAIDSASGELAATARLPQVALGPALFSRLGRHFPEVQEHTGELSGVAAVTANIGYHPGAPAPFTCALEANVKQLRLGHPLLPWPLEEGEAVVSLSGGRLAIDRLEGKLHGARVHASGELQALAADADFRATIRIEGLRLQKEMYDRLPGDLPTLCQQFSPDGLLSAECDIRRKQGVRREKHIIRPQGLSAVCAFFRYPAENVRGEIVQSLDSSAGPGVVTLDLTAQASGQPVRVKGRILGEGRLAGIEVDVTGEKLPIDAKLLRALTPFPQALQAVQDFKPTGRLDFHAALRSQLGVANAGGGRAMQNRFLFHIHDATICYKEFPYPMEELEGTLEIFPDGTWQFYNCTAKHRGGVFRGAGMTRHTPEGQRLDLVLQGTNALLDEEMKAALCDPDVQETWQMFQPHGRVDFTARIDSLDGGRPNLDLELTALGCTMTPVTFPYRLDDVHGTFHYAKQRVTLSEFQAKHGDTLVSLRGGEVRLKPNNGFWIELRSLRAEPLPVDRDFLKALPPLVCDVFATLKPDKPIRLVTDLTLDSPGDGQKPHIYWNGYVAFAKNTRLQCGVELADASGVVAVRGEHDGKKLSAVGNIQLDRATLFQQPLQDLTAHLEISDDLTVLEGVHANLHGGELYGQMRFNFVNDSVDYQVDMTASQIDLEKFARQSLMRKGQVKGKVFGRLYLTGRGNDARSMTGKGAIQIPQGKLYDLPVILDLLTFLSGRLPKGTAFEEAYAQFTIEGERLKVRQFDLLGDAISLSGQGEMKTDGTDIDMEMYGLLWGRTLPLLPPLLDQIPPTVSKQLMKLRMRGELGKVHNSIEPLPIVVEPLKKLVEKVSGRSQSRPARPTPPPGGRLDWEP